MKGGRKFTNLIWFLKTAEVAILLSDKIAFKPKLVRRDKEGHFINKKQLTKRN
jgi:hypothetical protein